MTRVPAAAIVALALWALADTPVLGVSAVFEGDPRAPGTQTPYEVLPGRPLVLPGPDGVAGTADDVVDAGIIGDVDLVVRSGTVPPQAVIPPPAAAGGRAALPVGVAGPRNAGGVEVPFTVFLSDGATSGAAPAGQLLAAADMDGIPVVVAAFADLDGDGVIGPTRGDARGDRDLAAELRELEPIGRGAALFSGGVASGAIAVQRGLPASRGGLTVALVAMALTGPFDASFLDGLIPSGPAIATALPFLPVRDLGRLIRDRPAAAGPASTLQELVQPAALPEPDTYALPLDGSVASIDAAVVMSQPAVRVSFRPAGSQGDTDRPLDRLMLGTRPPADRFSVRLVPVDRFENPADPPPDLTVTLRTEPILRVSGQRRRPRPLRVVSTAGRRIAAVLSRAAAPGSNGSLRVERDGIAIATLPFLVDSRANRPVADVVVPSAAAATIQAAVDGATDVNGDGVVAITLRRGVYREHVAIARALDLSGEAAGATVVVGDGTASVIAITAADATVRNLTVAGGSSGLELSGGNARVAASAAWRNVGPGVLLSAPGAELWASAVADNGGLGVAVAGASARCADNLVRGNEGPGIDVGSATTVQVIDNRVVDNDGAGVRLFAASSPAVRGNQCVLNIGVGIEVLESDGAALADNVCAANDDSGLRMDRADGALVTGNTLEDNNGYGVFLRRSPTADFAGAAGIQAPPGDNRAAGNRKGDVFVRPD